ncbi:MAG: cyclase family protein [Christensenellaceae bacterium]
MFVKLSYNINPTDPIWPGNPPFSADPHSLVANGDMSNTYLMHLFGHIGTHFDGPNHFNDKGPKVAELPLDAFIYEKPLLLEIPKSFGEMVMPEDLQPHHSAISKADLLMIRSGFQPQRTLDPHRYANEGPAISTAASKYIQDNFRLKAVALDWISWGSPLNIDNAAESHRTILGVYHDHYTCIIEDCNFEDIAGKTVKRVFAMPLFIDGVDSSPVTMFAEL